MDKAHVAQAAFGQGQVLATPLQIAWSRRPWRTAAQIMKPYVVAQVLDCNQKVLQQTKPQGWLHAHLGRDRGHARDLMVQVVTSGTGTSAAISGVQVAGKTGTAEVASGASRTPGSPASHRPTDPRVVVAVLVENGGTGGSVAAPIARQVIAAALGL